MTLISMITYFELFAVNESQIIVLDRYSYDFCSLQDICRSWREREVGSETVLSKKIHT